jgi:hypothetical protein
MWSAHVEICSALVQCIVNKRTVTSHVKLMRAKETTTVIMTTGDGVVSVAFVSFALLTTVTVKH